MNKLLNFSLLVCFASKRRFCACHLNLKMVLFLFWEKHYPKGQHENDSQCKIFKTQWTENIGRRGKKHQRNKENSIVWTDLGGCRGPTFVDEGQAAFKGLVDRAGDGKVVDQGFVVRHGPDLVIKEVEVAGAAATWCEKLE